MKCLGKARILARVGTLQKVQFLIHTEFFMTWKVIFMTFYDFLWLKLIFMTFYDFLWLFMIFYDSNWFLWLFMTFYDFFNTRHPVIRFQFRKLCSSFQLIYSCNSISFLQRQWCTCALQKKNSIVDPSHVSQWRSSIDCLQTGRTKIWVWNMNLQKFHFSSL